MLPENEDGLENASSAIIDRTTLGPSGGNLSFAGFLGLIKNIQRSDRELTWDQLEGTTAPQVDACEVEVMVSQYQGYNPGNCSGNLARQSTSPLWSSYLPGLSHSMTFPQLPDTWPRATANGLLSETELSNRESLRVRIRCSSFTESISGRFTGLTWQTLEPNRVSVNQVAY